MPDVPVTSAAQGRREGARAAVPFSIAALLVGISFGVVARIVGMPPEAAVAMSAIVNAGGSQVAAVGVLAAGGSLVAAVLAGVLVNLRFLPMGLSIGPSIPHGPVKRALYGQAIVDASWALSHVGDGRYDRHRLLGSTAAQYVGWVGGTAIGALAGGVIPDPDALGVDAIFPVFFLALLLPELREGEARLVAAGGAAVALVFALIAPAGAGIVLAAAVALVGLRRRRAPEAPA